MGNNYATRIDQTEVGTVKRYFRSPTSDIQEVILIATGEDLAEVAQALACEPESRRERGLVLADRGAIRFAVDEPSAVPGPWTPYAVALDDIDDDRACWVVYAPPTYYVKLERP